MMIAHAMRTISHYVQAHELLILAMTIRNVHNKTLVRKRTSEPSAQAHKLSISHRAEVHQLLITGLTTIICP